MTIWGLKNHSKIIKKIDPKFYEKNDKNKNGDFLKIVVLPSKNNDFQGSAPT